MEKRYIGIDLHRNRFTCCVRLENNRTYMTNWRLEDLPRFANKLRAADEVAVEITGNTRAVHHRRHAPGGTGGGGRYQPIPRDQPIGEEDRSKRRTAAGAVFVQRLVAGGADEE